MHSNSGVPNHGYALLVDGGTYNGRTVTAIGLDEGRAHLLARADRLPDADDATSRTTPTRSKQSCTDLIGQSTSTGLSTGAPGRARPVRSITAADCAAVTRDDRGGRAPHRSDGAVQLHSRCSTRTRPACARTRRTRRPSTTRTSRTGSRGWTLTNEGVFSGWPGTNWAARTRRCPAAARARRRSARTSRSATATSGAGDVSGVMRLDEPVDQAPERGDH